MTSDLFHFNTLNETCRNKEAEQQHSHQMAMSKLDDINKILHNLQDELLQKTGVHPWAMTSLVYMGAPLGHDILGFQGCTLGP
ncbi:hypothetical protein LSAT2_000391 [Lamellibrachia satsuma]|nr:hypothetical protein LSAT2_000391 [Lamellibrachia satsuma]